MNDTFTRSGVEPFIAGLIVGALAMAALWCYVEATL